MAEHLPHDDAVGAPPTRLSEDFLPAPTSTLNDPLKASERESAAGSDPKLTVDTQRCSDVQRCLDAPHCIESSSGTWRGPQGASSGSSRTQRSAGMPPEHEAQPGLSGVADHVSGRARIAGADPEHPSYGPAGCLDEDQVLAFAQGLVSGAALERAESHLDVCAECRQLLGEGMRAVDPMGVTEGGAKAEYTLLRPGDVVGQRYRILRFLACGGMGEVYEAYDGELGERVALKTISPAAGDLSRAVRYLKAEVQLARRVSHPNVCRTLEFGTYDIPRTGFRIHYLTMEFVEGESLGSYLRRCGPLSLVESKRLAEQILLGLSAAHEAGVLHRDLKTDNVLLRRGANGLQALLSDFGLARALDIEGQGARQSSQGWVGTPDYMAPEQLEGRPLTVASDLYAFGLVFFEMLTGKLPFPRCRHAVALHARLKANPAAPSSENPSVSAAWDSIVLRCLARDPKARFASAQEVLLALRSSPEEPRRPRGWFLGAALAGCALAVTLSWIFGLPWNSGRGQSGLGRTEAGQREEARTRTAGSAPNRIRPARIESIKSEAAPEPGTSRDQPFRVPSSAVASAVVPSAVVPSAAVPSASARGKNQVPWKSAAPRQEISHPLASSVLPPATALPLPAQSSAPRKPAWEQPRHMAPTLTDTPKP